MAEPKERSHFGMGGHFAAMSEFLLRGWNVAIPFVDVGDDVLVVEDEEATVHRVQVKTADGAEERDYEGVLWRKMVRYTLSRAQLAKDKQVELFFMFVVRWDDRWRFILLRRDVLQDIRKNFEKADRAGKAGRPPVGDDKAKADGVGIDVVWTRAGASGWKADLSAYVDQWPEEFPVVRTKASTLPTPAPTPPLGTPPAPTPGAAAPKAPSGSGGSA